MLRRRRVAPRRSVTNQTGRADTTCRSGMLSVSDLFVLKKKIELLRFKGAKFHFQQGEWTIALTQSPQRAQESAISAMSSAILVFALLLNSVASTAFSPLSNERNDVTGFAFNWVLGLCFTTAGGSTLFMSYACLILTLESEYGAYRQLIRYEQLMEFFLWLTAIAQCSMVALAMLAVVYKTKMENNSAMQGGSEINQEDANQRDLYSYLTLGTMLLAFQAQFFWFYHRGLTVIPVHLRHWALWLAPFVLQMHSKQNQVDCARVGEQYARMIVQNVNKYFNWRMFPYDPFFWSDLTFFPLSLVPPVGDEIAGADYNYTKEAGKQDGGQAEKFGMKAGEEFHQWCKLLKEWHVIENAEGEIPQGAGAGTGDDDAATKLLEDEFSSWCVLNSEFVDKHKVELVATELVMNDLCLSDFKKMALLSASALPGEVTAATHGGSQLSCVELCFHLLDSALEPSSAGGSGGSTVLLSTGQKMKLAMAICKYAFERTSPS
ncbi:unnamed protein product, partial [Amoebophrya sp. A120]|eukprot:GSA120T00004197001.1